jgi:hypothetical protein
MISIRAPFSFLLFAVCCLLFALRALPRHDASDARPGPSARAEPCIAARAFRMSPADDHGFLTRWARRKAQAQRGGEPGAATAVAPAAGATPVAAPMPPAVGVPVAPAVEREAPAAPEPAAPPPTLADVAALTRDSSYARYVAGDVATDVRNAAMKKLFGDPHFNVMDGLDVYIDDYGKPDPLPPGMLRRLAQSRLLGLFDDEQPAEPAAARPAADPCPTADEDPDLRLQPDDAAGREPGEPDRPDAGGDAPGQR